MCLYTFSNMAFPLKVEYSSYASQNFNTAMARNAKVTIVEVNHNLRCISFHISRIYFDRPRRSYQSARSLRTLSIFQAFMSTVSFPRRPRKKSKSSPLQLVKPAESPRYPQKKQQRNFSADISQVVLPRKLKTVST